MKLFSTSCETFYLGWDSPLLPQSVATLRDRFAKKGHWDLSGLICVLPSSRAVGRFGDLLHAGAEEHDLQLRLPQIITVGQLPEMLYQPAAPIALELEQTLAWAQVLRSTDGDILAPLVPVTPPAEPIGPWLELASTLRRLHEDLSSNRLSFRDVVEAAETDSEKRRWKLLTRLFDGYLESIEKAGLSDPHWARRGAVAADRCRSDKTIALIGTSDLSAAVVAMLRGLDSDLLAMVAAPANESSRFDEFGCVDTPSWTGHQLPVQDEQLIPAGDVADQATAVAETIADFAQRWSADQVTVGVTDESQVGPLEIELRGCGVKTYRHLGWTVSQTSIGRLLSLTGTYLQRRTWQAFSALIRHADVHRYVSHRLETETVAAGVDPGAWLTQVDQLLANHYPIRVADSLSPTATKNYPLAISARDAVEDWLSRFAKADQTIAAWSEVILAWIESIYVESEAGMASRTEKSLDAARRLLGRFVDLNDELDLRLGGGAAIETLSGRLSDVRIVQTPSADDVEILGWLDLALDDAPAMVVMGLNHPFVPAATTSDPFLPGSLRTRLRMGDNERRYARDVYAMHLIVSTRTAIRFVVGKTAADRSPTPPSRLLAAADRADSARRVRHLLADKRDPVVIHHRWDIGNETDLPIPQVPVGSPEIQSLSVTAFHDYLVCPYRFYLRHVLKLRPLDDAASELAANQFGDLVHAAVERFGESEHRHETEPSKIEAFLFENLDQYAAETYGDAASTAVSIQVAQARRRLQVVAMRQAERIAAGWRIHATEASVGEADGAGIEVDGERMGLRGRFDRIDRHQDGRWAILDYKTHGHRPEKKHLRKTEDGEQWVDLQLPLYRMMVPYLGIDAPPAEVQLGYFNVAEKEEETRINIAEFSEEQMRQAEEVIRQCVRGIRSGDFAPTGDRVQFDDYSMILQTGVANRLLDQAEIVMEEVES